MHLQENAPTQLSKSEKAQQAILSEDNMSVTLHKGYRMVRACLGMCCFYGQLHAANISLSCSSAAQSQDMNGTYISTCL